MRRGDPAAGLPDPVPVRGLNAVLNFEMDTSGYVFVQENAVVVTAGGNEFPQPSNTSPDGKSVTLHDRNTSRADFKYTVTVQPQGGGKPIVYDPTIQNENGG